MRWGNFFFQLYLNDRCILLICKRKLTIIQPCSQGRQTESLRALPQKGRKSRPLYRNFGFYKNVSPSSVHLLSTALLLTGRYIQVHVCTKAVLIVQRKKNTRKSHKKPHIKLYLANREFQDSQPTFAWKLPGHQFSHGRW